jgi:hypothetical protein
MIISREGVHRVGIPIVATTIACEGIDVIPNRRLLAYSWDAIFEKLGQAIQMLLSSDQSQVAQFCRIDG